MSSSRKKTSLLNVIVSPSEVKEVYVNKRPLGYYLQRSLDYVELDEILEDLPIQRYDLKVKGGGSGSIIEVVFKTLFKHLRETDQRKLKIKHPEIDRTDGRRSYPHKYGGKSRKRSQKSYR
jgi:ribosomal protein S9